MHISGLWWLMVIASFTITTIVQKCVAFPIRHTMYHFALLISMTGATQIELYRSIVEGYRSV